jgi:hypothetical protein
MSYCLSLTHERGLSLAHKSTQPPKGTYGKVDISLSSIKVLFQLFYRPIGIAAALIHFLPYSIPLTLNTAKKTETKQY